MRGSPLVRALIAFAVLLALGIPLWRLTHAASAPRTPPAAEESALLHDIHLQLVFTHPPAKIAVRHLGETVWEKGTPGVEIGHDLKLAFPNEGVDLEFAIEWPPETWAAARVRLTDPGGDEHERTIWGRGPAEEVLTFP